MTDFVAIPGSAAIVRSSDSVTASPHQLTKEYPVVFTVHLRPMIQFHPGAASQRLSLTDFADKHGASDADIQSVRQWVEACGLTVNAVRPAARIMIISGSHENIAKAFNVQLWQHIIDNRVCHANLTDVAVPVHLVNIIQAVLGLDTRPLCTPKIRWHQAEFHPRTAGEQPLLPTAVARLYQFPRTGFKGAPQGIGILELGGGRNASDERAYFEQLGLPAPIVSDVPVDGSSSQPGDPNGADGEVALDIQVAAGCYSYATGRAAQVFMGWCQNTDSGFVTGIAALAHSGKVSVISISWGSPETNWTSSALKQMEQVLQGCGALGVTVTVAAGDGGSTDGTGSNVTDYPAASAWVLGIGGTTLIDGGNNTPVETVWNNGANGGATGGGVSQIYPAPDYQANTFVAGTGRGVPDLASNADPNTGFPILVDGQSSDTGGTSAGAPLVAAAVAVINESLGSTLGFFNPKLYQLSATCFHDVTQGNNGGYAARVGYDCCTGRGSLNVSQIIAELSSATPTPSPTPSPSPILPPAPSPTPGNPSEAQVQAVIDKIFNQEIAAWHASPLMRKILTALKVACDRAIQAIYPH